MSAPTATPPAELRTAAFQAIARATEESPHLSVTIVAAKILRDQTGLGLAEVIPAVKWALANPQAERLPVDSIVADGTTVAIKRVTGDSHDRCWQSTRDGTDGAPWLTDADVDRMIRDGGATVLRVGGGS